MTMVERYCDTNAGSFECSRLYIGAPEDMYLAIDYTYTNESYYCVAYVGAEKAEILSKVSEFKILVSNYKYFKMECETFVLSHVQEWSELISSEYKKLTQPVSTYSRENSINVYRIERAADKALFTAVIFPNKVEIFSGLAYMPYATLHGIYTPHAVIAYLDNELQIGCDRKEPAMVGEHSHRI